MEENMNPQEVRDLVHNIINFANDEVGRKLVETTTVEWSGNNNVDVLTNEQAQALMTTLTEVVKQSAFTILAKY
jgi:hypothetical protein|tara:strand:- start:730 stop:951 length:222 start_codon:yes stop_codon:yes gene_type:complete